MQLDVFLYFAQFRRNGFGVVLAASQELEGFLRFEPAAFLEQPARTDVGNGNISLVGTFSVVSDVMEIK